METNIKILVTDDEPENLRIVGQTLKRDGLQFIFATNGKDAIEAAINEQPSLILLDIMMPAMDGIETCRRLKSQQKTSDIPVIFLSAKSQNQDILEGFGAGGVDYITKPFFREELLSRIHTHLKLYNANQQLNALIEQKRELLAMLAHDVKNPSGAITKLAEALIEDIENKQFDADEFESCLSIIKSASEDLTLLVSEILDEEANEDDGIPLDPDISVDVVDIIRHIVDLNSVYAAEKSIRIQIEGPSKLPTKASRRILTEIFDNLINNAVKYSPPNSDVTVRLTKSNQRAIGFRFEVDDSADLIPAAKREALFGRFVSENQDTQKDLVCSHGLGLSIVKRLVQIVDGAVGIDTRANGLGNQFYVEIPLAN